MGAEATCQGVVDGRQALGKAKLETATLEFRAPDLKVVVPFGAMTKVLARNDRLIVCAGTRAIELALGAAVAARWAEKILHPPSRLKKLGVKPGWRVALVGDVDESLVVELTPAVAHVSRRAGPKMDAIFLFVRAASDLAKLATLKASLADGGALWLVRHKGDAGVSENVVMHAGRAAGLVDVKVVGFSPERSALKFVIPKSAR